jgi:hypothetical protein
MVAAAARRGAPEPQLLPRYLWLDAMLNPYPLSGDGPD